MMATAKKTPAKKAAKPKAAPKAVKSKTKAAPKVDGRLKSVADPAIDWEGATKAWRAGVLSGRAIADLYSIPEATLRQKMDELGIKRDLSDEVRKEVRAQIARTEMGVDNATEEEIITEAANTQVAIIRTHQRRLSKLTSLVETLAEELERDSATREELEAAIIEETQDDENPNRRKRMLQALSLGDRAGTLSALAASAQRLITLERQAHGIEAHPGDKKGNDLSDVLELIDGKSAGLPFGGQ